jgi:hypothetical protein
MPLAAIPFERRGLTADPDEGWMKHTARNLTALDDVFLVPPQTERGMPGPSLVGTKIEQIGESCRESSRP